MADLPGSSRRRLCREATDGDCRSSYHHLSEDPDLAVLWPDPDPDVAVLWPDPDPDVVVLWPDPDVEVLSEDLEVEGSTMFS